MLSSGRRSNNPGVLRHPNEILYYKTAGADAGNRYKAYCVCARQRERSRFRISWKLFYTLAVVEHNLHCELRAGERERVTRIVECISLSPTSTFAI